VTRAACKASCTTPLQTIIHNTAAAPAHDVSRKSRHLLQRARARDMKRGRVAACDTRHTCKVCRTHVTRVTHAAHVTCSAHPDLDSSPLVFTCSSQPSTANASTATVTQLHARCDCNCYTIACAIHCNCHTIACATCFTCRNTCSGGRCVQGGGEWGGGGGRRLKTPGGGGGGGVATCIAPAAAFKASEEAEAASHVTEAAHVACQCSIIACHSSHRSCRLMHLPAWPYPHSPHKRGWAATATPSPVAHVW